MFRRLQADHQALRAAWPDLPVMQDRLVLAHAPNLMDLMGYFPKEGTLVVFRPLGEAAGFEYIASIPAAQWGELLRQGQK